MHEFWSSGDPQAAGDAQAGEQDRVAFTPALVKRYPAPRTWVRGNLRDTEIVRHLLRVCGVDAKS